MLAKVSPARRLSGAAVALAVTSGSTDALAFLALGGAFTSVMTGNLVLLGISLGQRDPRLAEQIALAVVGYVLGCAVGARIAGKPGDGDPGWPPAVTKALMIESVLFLGYAVGWWVAGAQPGAVMKALLLGVCAIALGVQSAAVRRFGVSGLSTTYLTGTLTTLIIRLASGERLRDVALDLGLLAALVVGAAIAALLLALDAGLFVPIVQLGPLAAVLAVALIARSARATQTGD
ncbi:DUF1275 domain-containing protein [Mycolicibacterium moriokaense]|nr:DUF1275 domain-containing protein [Mycolicibacterium moriokaense]